MKKTLSILVASLCTLLAHGNMHAIERVDQLPSETIILNLPNHEAANWREIERNLTSTQGTVERIPKNQTPENWSEIITVQFFHKSQLDKSLLDSGGAISIVALLERFRETFLSEHPANRATWKIIEQNSHDAIYEWKVRPFRKNGPSFHSITRVFLTATGYHSVAFERRDAEMSPNEREKWIGLLKRSASVISFEKAAHTSEGLSIADTLQNSVDLGAFKNWKIAITDTYTNGMTIVSRIPPLQTELTAKESILVRTIPNMSTLSLNELFSIEISGSIKQSLTVSPEKASVSVLKKSDTEFIYSCSQLVNTGHHTTISRTILADGNYYTICYGCDLDRSMSKDELQQWKEKLETISISH